MKCKPSIRHLQPKNSSISVHNVRSMVYAPLKWFAKRMVKLLHYQRLTWKVNFSSLAGPRRHSSAAAAAVWPPAAVGQRQRGHWQWDSRALSRCERTLEINKRQPNFHIGINTPKFAPPRWGRPRFDPTQTGLCKLGRGFGAASKWQDFLSLN